MSEGKLDELRSEIDTLDEQILVLFDERQRVSKQIGFIKNENGWPIVDEKRKALALSTRLEFAQGIGLSEKDVKDIFELFHKKAVEIQRED